MHTDQYGFVLNFEYQQRDLTQKGKDVLRVFVLGGSTIFGLGSEKNSDTIPAQLEVLLNGKRPFSRQKFEVINAGVGAYITSNELRLLAFKILKFQPDIVITFDGYNDFLNTQTNFSGKSGIRNQKGIEIGSWDLNKTLFDGRAERIF